MSLEFYNWQQSDLPLSAPYNSCSPNLVALNKYLLDKWGGQRLGCYSYRPIVGGTSISSHGRGAALDWRYESPGIGRQRMLNEVIPWVIENHVVLGIQAIHDYAGSRIWRCNRLDVNGGWRAQATGSQMGQSWALWLHFETSLSEFTNTTPIEDRLSPAPVPPAPPVTPSKGPVEMYQIRYRKAGWPGEFTAKVTVDAIHHTQNGDASVVDAQVGGVPDRLVTREQLVALLQDRGRRHVSIDANLKNAGQPFSGQYADTELAQLWTQYQW